MDESLSSPPGTLGVMPLHVVEGLQEMGEEERHEEEEEGLHASAYASVGPSKASTKKDLLAPPFKVSEGLPAVLPRLVAKIQRGEYVDMAELLRENIEADRRRSSQGIAAAVAVCSLISWKAGGRREVPNIMSWVQCFGTYACVLSDKFPHLVHQTLMVREAPCCSGQGWRDYDAMFHQQAGSAEELEWDKLNSSLYAVTFLAHTRCDGKPCRRWTTPALNAPWFWTRSLSPRHSWHGKTACGNPSQSGSASLGTEGTAGSSPIAGSGTCVWLKVVRETLVQQTADSPRANHQSSRAHAMTSQTGRLGNRWPGTPLGPGTVNCSKLRR